MFSKYHLSIKNVNKCLVLLDDHLGKHEQARVGADVLVDGEDLHVVMISNLSVKRKLHNSGGFAIFAELQLYQS